MHARIEVLILIITPFSLAAIGCEA